MKSLSEIISSTPKYPPSYSEADLINLNEHLRSLTPDELLFKLRRMVSDKIVPVGHYGDNQIKMAMVLDIPIGVVNSRIKKEQFVKLLDSMMWYITQDFGKADKKWRIGVEPVQADDVTQWVQSHDYIFHITSKERTQNQYSGDTIEDIGLRPRKANYRYFPKRIHFICPDNGAQFKEQLFQLVNQLQIKLENLRIFRIDLSKLRGVNFYRDPMYDEPNFIYAFVKIPWDYMEEIKLK